MTLDDLIPATTRTAVASAGLHKIAGAMLGVPELRAPDALRAIGERAYRRRKEARAIAEGIGALGALTGEKVADSPALMALLRRAAVPALAGAGIAAAPKLLSNDPMQPPGGVVHDALLGALLGGAGGVAHGMHGLPAGLGQEVAGALR
jgi:hypothetical protein